MLHEPLLLLCLVWSIFHWPKLRTEPRVAQIHLCSIRSKVNVLQSSLVETLMRPRKRYYTHYKVMNEWMLPIVKHVFGMLKTQHLTTVVHLRLLKSFLTFVSRSRICPYDVVIVTTPMYEKKHWDGDLADLTGQCVKVGHEMFEIFERWARTS